MGGVRGWGGGPTLKLKISANYGSGTRCDKFGRSNIMIFFFFSFCSQTLGVVPAVHHRVTNQRLHHRMERRLLPFDGQR